MSTSFAGSRSLDERRRRRLATEADEPMVAVRAAHDTSGRRSRKKRGHSELNGTRLPLRKIISAHRWKIWMLGLCLLIPVAGIVFGAFRLESVERAAGPAVARLLDPTENRLGRAWGSFLLLISSQLSVLIWWVRSRSPADFGGRFSVWLWAAAGCFLFSACVATDAHLFFADTVLHFRLVHFPQLGPVNTKLLCWLAPSALFGAGLVRSVYLDMRRCWSSVITLCLAVTGWVGAAFLNSQSTHALAIPHRELAALGSVLMGHVALMLSLLLHARFVLYQTSAPPIENRDAGGFLGFLKLFRRTPAPEPEPAESLETPRKSKSTSKRSTKSTKKSSVRKSSRTTPAIDSSDEIESEADEADASESETDDFHASQPSSRPAISAGNKASAKAPSTSGRTNREEPATPVPTRAVPERSEPRQHHSNESRNSPNEDAQDDDNDPDSDLRFDGPEDKEALKGLSKRERRRLQKQWREQQRS